MTSEEKNIEIKCLNCELYKKEIQEKDIKIKTLESNLLKIKSLLSESGSLIDGYNEIMEENKNLKMEIERLNNTINKTSNENYQFDLLKKKILRFQEENEKLRSSMQFYESQKNQNLHLKNGNEIKIKRELSLKDKEINQLNTVISLLKMHSNEQQLSNEDIIKKYSKNKINYNNNNSNDGNESDMYEVVPDMEQYAQDNISQYTDICEKDKQFFKLWNSFIKSEENSLLKFKDILIKFLNVHSKFLCENDLKRNFILHLVAVYDNRQIDDDNLTNIIDIMDKAFKQYDKKHN